MSNPIPPDVLARITRLRLELPRGQSANKPWKPVTPAEDMLLRQCTRLDGIRRQLLAELQRLNGQQIELISRYKDLQRAVPGQPSSPAALSPELYEVIAAAVAGEGLDATARRLQISQNTLKYRRKRVLQRYKAATFTQAVALAVAAGDVRPSRTGGAP